MVLPLSAIILCPDGTLDSSHHHWFRWMHAFEVICLHVRAGPNCTPGISCSTYSATRCVWYGSNVFFLTLLSLNCGLKWRAHVRVPIALSFRCSYQVCIWGLHYECFSGERLIFSPCDACPGGGDLMSMEGVQCWHEQDLAHENHVSSCVIAILAQVCPRTDPEWWQNQNRRTLVCGGAFKMQELLLLVLYYVRLLSRAESLMLGGENNICHKSQKVFASYHEARLGVGMPVMELRSSWRQDSRGKIIRDSARKYSSWTMICSATPVQKLHGKETDVARKVPR